MNDGQAAELGNQIVWHVINLKIKTQEVEVKIMVIETGAAVSKQKLTDIKGRLLALKEHL